MCRPCCARQSGPKTTCGSDSLLRSAGLLPAKRDTSKEQCEGLDDRRRRFENRLRCGRRRWRRRHHRPGRRQRFRRHLHGRRRLRNVIVRDDAPDGGEDLLHGRFVRFCRLVHSASSRSAQSIKLSLHRRRRQPASRYVESILDYRWFCRAWGVSHASAGTQSATVNAMWMNRKSRAMDGRLPTSANGRPVS